MSPSLIQLALTREARREAAIAKLSAARRQCELIHAACLLACAEVEQSRHWRTEVLAGCTLGAGQAIRESVLPSSDALLQQSQQRFAQKQFELRLAYERVGAEHRALMTCERDLLRLQEWQKLQQSRQRRDLAMQENRLDDEQSPRSSIRARAA